MEKSTKWCAVFVTMYAYVLKMDKAFICENRCGVLYQLRPEQDRNETKVICLRYFKRYYLVLQEIHAFHVPHNLSF